MAGYLGDVGPRRRARASSTVGAAAVAAVLGFSAISQLAGWGSESATLLAYECVLVAIALGLLADLRRGWSQAAVTGLVVDLGELWEPVTLRGRLARALGDSVARARLLARPRTGLRRRGRTAARRPGPGCASAR